MMASIAHGSRDGVKESRTCCAGRAASEGGPGPRAGVLIDTSHRPVAFRGKSPCYALGSNKQWTSTSGAQNAQSHFTQSRAIQGAK